jgi:DNA-binding response OmpR family regulator
MNILIAEDDPVARQTIDAILTAAGHKTTVTSNGQEAWDMWLLSQHRVVISDWMMPQVDGLEFCLRVRARHDERYTYFILLTSKSGRESYLAAMEAGVDDFIVKPVDPEELRARLQVAQRILGLREELYALEGLLPICSYCKRIRNDAGRWDSLEGYIEARSTAQFSHGICPECYDKHVEPQFGSSD